MKHLFIPYDLAVIAKEKGFKEDCFAYFRNDKLRYKTEQSYGESEYHFDLTDFIGNWNDGWSENDEGQRCFGCNNDKRYYPTYSAPLYQQIIDWFREKHEIIFLTVPNGRNPVKFGFIIPTCYTPNKEGIVPRGIEPKGYYEALDWVIEEAFKLI